MTASSSPFFVRPSRSAFGLLTLLVALALPSFGLAQDSEKDKKQLSDKIREGMVKFGPLQEAKKWDEAIALLTDLQKQALPDTFDAFELDYVKGQIFLTIDQLPQAIEPLETALRISDAHNFFDDKEERKVLKYLYQLYYGEGSVKGITPAKQEQYFIKAGDYVKRRLDLEKANHETLDTDDVVFYAYLLLQRAQANAEKPDPALLKQARSLAEEGLLLSIAPRPEFYRLLLSIVLAQNDYASGAEILELLLKKEPKNKDNWTQLCAIYLNLGLDDKDKRKAFDNNVRAIVTYERAQALGYLTTPKDNFDLVGTYYNIGQVDQAARLLETDLKNGSVASDQKYWTYVAQWYQQIDQPLKAIDVIKEAAKHFPNSGEFDQMAATNYYGLEKYEEAYQQAKIAATKGLGDKTWQAWSFMAYTAFTELRKYDEALEAVNKALSYPDSKKDKQLPGLKEAIEKAIKDRNAQTEALKARIQQ